MHVIGPHVIQVDHLTKRFGTLAAVDDLTVTVRPGRVTGLLGPNGAGKTTTMNVVLGLQAPTSGRTLVAGRPYRTYDRPLRHVGALLAAEAVHPARSARAHLTWVAQTNGISRRRVDVVLASVGLDPVADKRLRGFSQGMKQRLGLAQALLGDAPILIFDEPANGLDPEGIEWLRHLLKQLAAEGRTVLVSSHLMGEMALTADHLIVIGRGRLLADASLEEFIAAHTRADVVVRTPSATALADRLREQGATVAEDTDDPTGLVVGSVPADVVGEIAAAAGIVLHELRDRAATLEDAYLALTHESVEFGRTP
jgi:ABC-2 type transport system ATP-binding protein